MQKLTPSISSKYRLLPLSAAVVLLGASAALAADYASTVLQDMPVAYYRFEDPPGTTNLTESSGSGIPATVFYPLNATNPIFGQLGLQTNSVYFNGTPTWGSGNGHPGTIDVAFRQELSPTNVFGLTNNNGYLKGGPFSVECWTRSFGNRSDSKYEGLIGVTGGYSGSLPTKWGGWMLGKDSTFHWVFLMRNGSTLTGPIPVLMQWYHLVATFDGTNSFFYVNGVQIATGGASANANYVPSNYDGVSRMPNIGNSRYSGDPWYGYKGDVDEVAFYTNALTLGQVQLHYQIGTNSIALPPQPPVVLKDPVDTTNYANTPVTFTASAGGDLPLSYQWLRGGSPIDGATNSALTFTSAYPADDGATFSVIITNRAGSTNTAQASLTVSTDLITAPAPEDGSLLSSITRNVGSYAAFRPVVYGARPIGYQWYRNDVLLPGETNPTLWLTNVQTADSGASFSVQVTNPWNSTTLSAFLTVQERPVTVPLQGYGAIVAADHPVAYWRLNEIAGSYTAVDAVGSFDGQCMDISSGAVGLFTYELPTGIPAETDLALGVTNGAIINVPYAAELNSDTTWSAETWVKPSVLSDNPNVNYVVLSSEYNHSTSLYNDWNGWYITHGAGHAFNFILLPAANAGTITAGPDDADNNNQIVADNWYHLVLSKDATNFNLFINGKLRGSRPVATTSFIQNGTWIRPENGNQGHGETMIGSLHDRSRAPFAGTVDDTAFYNYALSPERILMHYLNSTNITPPSVTLNIANYANNVVLTWSQGTLQAAPAVTGTFTNVPTATSPYTNAIGDSTFFRVKVQ